MGSDSRVLIPRATGLGRAGALLLVALAAVAVPAPTLAQTAADEKPPSAADKETARSLMDQGVEREEAKDYIAALKAYQGAHALVRLPMTGMAVARTLATLGQLVEALDVATEVKLMPKRAGETPAYARARTEAEALTEKLIARTPSVQVTVEGGPVSVEIAIDGVVVPAAAATLPRKIDPGKHVIAAMATGYEKVTVEVMVPEGNLLPVKLSMKRLPGDQGANGAGAGQTGVGKKDGATPDKPEGGGLSPLVFVGFGVGVAGIVAGSVTGALSLSRTSAIEKKCTLAGNGCPADQEDEISGATTLANISNVTFALGAAGVAVGVVGIFLSGGSKEKPKETGTSRIRVMPAVGPGSVAIVGTF